MMLALIIGAVGLVALVGNLPSDSELSRWFTLPVPSEENPSVIQRDIDEFQQPKLPQAETGTGVTMQLLPQEGRPGDWADLYEQVRVSIVSIQSRGRRSYSGGTGVILTQDGYILTNAHVIEGSLGVEVQLWNNHSYEAELVGYDFAEDLAVLKIDAERLVPARFGDSELLRPGDAVAAVGDPLGYSGSISEGIISGLDRDMEVDGVTMDLIQTSAPINFGNSGGALLNDRGQVIGITTIKMVSEDGDIEGLGFAIPSARVKFVVDRLIAGEEIVHSAFGITVDRRHLEEGGILVLEVSANSGAQEAGLKPRDVIVAVEGRAVSDTSDLARITRARGVGDLVEITVRRGEDLLELTIPLVKAEG
jgi:S1-C subfamily serine protease